MIGMLAGIGFTVSEGQVQTFAEMSRETSARWSAHEVIGAKPKQEFLGPDLGGVSFTMHLAAWRGVSPIRLAEQLREFCSNGEYDNLILGGRNMGKYLIESVGETYGVVTGRNFICRCGCEFEGVSLMIVTGKNLSPDLREQVEVLIGTPVGTVVLDRDFGIDLSFLDMPIGQAANAAAAEIAVKIERYIPGLQLEQVKPTYPRAAEGKVELEVIVRNAK